MTEGKTIDRIPEYLRVYVVDQKYETYTPRDQAVWRFIMRNARQFLEKNAHPVYLEGLEKTGIPISQIPRVDHMDGILGKFGWGAVCVRGFIPPLAFLDFQARKILPIAADMRTLEHILYTPAPDIVHEAAGHAPILADPQYAQYLTEYAQMARKAIYSFEDIRLYEAIRVLSDTKENPDSLPEEIEAAEQRLQEASDAVTWVSEAATVSRMNWWTAEYGLIGDLENPQIFGAGLLSSIGEGRNCLTPAVKKIQLSIECVQQTYDITKPQPQLYVARDFSHLSEVLRELDSSLSYRKGGVQSLEVGLKSKALTSTVFDSGLIVTGVIESYHAEGDQIEFIKWSGPVQLSENETEIRGHGRQRHAHGFSSPLGELNSEEHKHLAVLSERELASIGLVQGQKVELEFQSGFVVSGEYLSRTPSQDGKHNLLLTFKNCTVTRRGKTYFEPEWGEFDLGLGCGIASVFGGPADWHAYGEYDLGKASTSPSSSQPPTAKERQIFEVYASLRALRNDACIGRDRVEQELRKIIQRVNSDFPEEWLIGLEIIEIAKQRLRQDPESIEWLAPIFEFNIAAARKDPSLLRFVEIGLEISQIPD